VGISTSTEPTLYGPVCAGKDGVGLRRLNQAILTTASGLALPIGRREGMARVIDLKAREKDSVVDAQ
jgi:hypothetical protein